MPDEASLQGAHVELKDISKSFGGTRALEGVTLAIGRGSIHALVGENGAGKSTLGKIIAGAHAPDDGQLLLAGEPVRFHSPRDASWPPRSGSSSRPGPERKSVRDVLARVDARGGGQPAPGASLSGGNQQKLLFARSLLRDPLVLIADEPTRGVDVGAKRAIYDLLASLTARGLGVLLISSDVEEILGLAHRVLVMRGGRVAAELAGDDVTDVTEAAVLGAAFGAAGKGA